VRERRGKKKKKIKIKNDLPFSGVLTPEIFSDRRQTDRAL
jgi:hypothetical protein